MRNSVPINLEEMDKFLERCNLSGLNQEEREDMNHQFQVPNGIRDLKTANCAGGPAARTRLPVQVRSPVRELDPTCLGEGGGSLMPQKDPAQPDYTCIYAQKTESPGPEGNGHPLQYSCLENPMDRGAWWAAVHGVAKSRTQLSD